jgi:hypothetical protein
MTPSAAVARAPVSFLYMFPSSLARTSFVFGGRMFFHASNDAASSTDLSMPSVKSTMSFASGGKDTVIVSSSDNDEKKRMGAWGVGEGGKMIHSIQRLSIRFCEERGRKYIQI